MNESGVTIADDSAPDLVAAKFVKKSNTWKPSWYHNLKFTNCWSVAGGTNA